MAALEQQTQNALTPFSHHPCLSMPSAAKAVCARAHATGGRGTGVRRGCSINAQKGEEIGGVEE